MVVGRLPIPQLGESSQNRLTPRRKMDEAPETAHLNRLSAGRHEAIDRGSSAQGSPDFQQRKFYETFCFDDFAGADGVECSAGSG